MWCARRSAVPQPAQARCRHSPSLSLSVLIAAALDHLVGSSAVRVRAGDIRPACIEARATALSACLLACSFACLLRVPSINRICSALTSCVAGRQPRTAGRPEARESVHAPEAVPVMYSKRLLQHRMTHTRQRSRSSGRTDWRVLCGVPVGRPFRSRRRLDADTARRCRCRCS